MRKNPPSVTGYSREEFRLKESVLQEKVLAYYQKRNKKIFSEIPFMSRVIDLLVIEKKAITSYELKIDKWQKAIEQMKEHRIAADYCYLCMPKRANGRSNLDKIIEDLRFFGFGLILWNEESLQPEEILPAKKSGYISKPAVRKLRKNIEVLACPA